MHCKNCQRVAFFCSKRKKKSTFKYSVYLNLSVVYSHVQINACCVTIIFLFFNNPPFNSENFSYFFSFHAKSVSFTKLICKMHSNMTVEMRNGLWDYHVLSVLNLKNFVIGPDIYSYQSCSCTKYKILNFYFINLLTHYLKK